MSDQPDAEKEELDCVAFEAKMSDLENEQDAMTGKRLPIIINGRFINMAAKVKRNPSPITTVQVTVTTSLYGRGCSVSTQIRKELIDKATQVARGERIGEKIQAEVPMPKMPLAGKIEDNTTLEVLNDFLVIWDNQ